MVYGELAMVSRVWCSTPWCIVLGGIIRHFTPKWWWGGDGVILLVLVLMPILVLVFLVPCSLWCP